MRYAALIAFSVALAWPGGAQTQAPAAREPQARQPTPAQAAQQQRMRDCNAEARRRNLSGTERSAFMRPCLSGNMPTAGAS